MNCRCLCHVNSNVKHIVPCCGYTSPISILEAKMNIKEATDRIKELEERTRVLDIVVAHTRWIAQDKRKDVGEFITLLNTVNSFKEELESLK